MHYNSVMVWLMKKWMLMSLTWIVFPCVGRSAEHSVKNTDWLHICMSVPKCLVWDGRYPFWVQISNSLGLLIWYWFCARAAWKESDYFFTQSVRTNRGQQQRWQQDRAAFKHLCLSFMTYVRDINAYEEKKTTWFFFFFLLILSK